MEAVENPVFPEGRTHVDQIVQPVCLVLFKIVGIHGLGVAFLLIEKSGKVFVEPGHTLLKSLSFTVYHLEVWVQGIAVFFNGICDLRPQTHQL